MKATSILFATDFSSVNDSALDVATALAEQSHATLHIVHVQDIRALKTADGEAKYLRELEWQKEKQAGHLRFEESATAQSTVKCERHYLTGDPADEIAAYAEENGIDLIVMSSHGRSGISRLLMGSVAEGVMRKAPCAVLIVKPQADRKHGPLFPTIPAAEHASS